MQTPEELFENSCTNGDIAGINQAISQAQGLAMNPWVNMGPMRAAENGHTEVLRHIMRPPFHDTISQSDKIGLIFNSCRGGHIDTILFCLSLGVINLEYALIGASERNHQNVVQMIINLDNAMYGHLSDGEYRFISGKINLGTATMAACNNNHLELQTWLLLFRRIPTYNNRWHWM